MANTLENLQPDIYSALDIVSRERVGLITACHMDAQATRAAVNETVRVPIAPAATAEDITPGSVAPDTGDQTIANETITITKARSVPFRWTGEEQRGVNNGPGYRSIQALQIAQALRTLTNEVEADLALLYKRFSRAYGTAGTAPFGTANDFSDVANVLRILEDNGAPASDLQLVLSPAAMANLRAKQTTLFQVNTAGTDEFLREGFISNGWMGFQLRQSKQMPLHTKGTATGYDANGGEPAGETTIAVDGSDSGTILAGDVVTWAGDTNKYVVRSATASGASSGNIVLNAPGLQAALATGVEGTTGANYTPSLAFHRQAVVLAARQPALPEEGDNADEVMSITDPVSGITFEFAIYKEHRRVRYQVGLAWGCSVVKDAHTAILLG